MNPQGIGGSDCIFVFVSIRVVNTLLRVGVQGRKRVFMAWAFDFMFSQFLFLPVIYGTSGILFIISVE